MASLFRKTVQGAVDFVSNGGLFTKSDLEHQYLRPAPSFSKQLPYCGYDVETETMILEDEVSRAVSLTIEPIATEGRSFEYLSRIRDALEDVYEAFDPKGDSEGQWVIQEFSYDDTSIDALMQKIEANVIEHAKGTRFTEEYMHTMRHHFTGLKNAKGGLFVDKEVTGEPWGLKVPRTKIIIYRRVTSSETKSYAIGKYDPARELNQLVEDMTMKFRQAGVKVSRDGFNETYTWLFGLFNPSIPGLSDEEYDEFKKNATDVDPEVVSGSMAESLLCSNPESSVEDNAWTLGGKVSRFIRFGGLRKAPRVGQLTGEVVTGEGNNAMSKCLLDALPHGSILSKTVVITTQSEFDLRMLKMEKASRSQTASAEQMRSELLSVRGKDGGKRKVLCSVGLYLFADDLEQLNDAQRKAITVMNNNNIILYRDDIDGLSLNAFLMHLPMNFRPELDKKRHYLRSMYAQHAANLSLTFGRSEGSGRPCMIGFSRGGAPVMFDPFSPDEKSNNSFGFIVGGPGSGKSVSIAAYTYSIMAMKRPRMFIVEYGNSFSVAAQDWRAKGLTVNEMVLSAKNCPSLAPFASIDKVLDDVDLDSTIENVEVSDAEIGDDVDYLGELELIAFMMITGSESKEMDRYNRGDRALVRRALVKTAERNRKKGFDQGLGKAFPTITADVMDTLVEMSKNVDGDISSKQADMLAEMAQSLEGFTTGFNGDLFNRPGEEWPDADVTLINLATLSSENNRDKLQVAYTSLSQYVNNLAEATQNSPRDIVMFTDEAHLLLGNDMLAEIIIKQVKTARKLGVWPQICTQNVNDCSGKAEKLLSMIEWYYCLNTSVSEAKLIGKYKQLTDEQQKLITSTRKQARAYTEGVVLSDKNEYQFRSVPPSLYLAVAMTESAEKAQRSKIQTDENLSCELEAAYFMANSLDKARGISGELSYKDMIGRSKNELH
ncbi:conjugative transfer ATPase [Vibrio barjaei]|uniref:conjugative transfer ATPase n=1 Tax=Vibrio barjaei TaxID=1676683 RepID=UPI002284DF79|nr:conjugative transfer ATPase [Vibrio barjaei]MCY9874551.1 conjugative transfer ATPase [Vibrio barjaei]